MFLKDLNPIELEVSGMKVLLFMCSYANVVPDSCKFDSETSAGYVIDEKTGACTPLSKNYSKLQTNFVTKLDMAKQQYQITSQNKDPLLKYNF